MNMQQTSELIKAIINPVVIAAAVTAITSVLALIGNIVVAYFNNRRLKVIEKSKHISELEQYRYTKLYSLLEDFQQEIVFTEKKNMGLEERVSYLSEKRAKILQIHYRSSPLIERSIRAKLPELLSQDEKLWESTLLSFKENDNENDLGKVYDEYIEVAEIFHVELNRAISQQIEVLTNKV
jgi:hypothetical protein